MKKLLFLVLMMVAMSAQSRSGFLESLGINDNSEPLPVEQAFVFSGKVINGSNLDVQWDIAPGNYLYKDKIRFEVDSPSDITLANLSLPAGENKMDEIFGLSEVYTSLTNITVPLNRSTESAQSLTLTAFYQGCSETFRICYPPTQSTLTLALPAIDNAITSTTMSDSPLELSQQDRIAKSLAEDSLITVLLGFLGLGLLLAFTPCVFPMIPILSSIIIGEGERISTHRAFVLSLSYVLAMSVTYTAAGIITGLLGENLQAMFQNPWIIGSFSGLFVLFALSMFGLFELQLPHAVQHHLHQLNHRQRGGHIAGAATMGLLSGLIVGPCLAPPLAGALIFIGQSGDPVLGGMALFALSMGMGLPLLIIGTSAGSLLPKAGDWMVTIKAIFGVLMLALAIWMIERVIPSSIVMMLWGVLAVGVGIFIGAMNSLKIDSNGWEKSLKSAGVILLLYGAMLIIGAASGSTNVWQPLDKLSTSGSANASTSNHVAFKPINNLSELNQSIGNNKVAMLDLYADWCIECKRMEATTFQDPQVITTLSSIDALQVDMTENNSDHKALLKQFGVFGPPTLLFFDAMGNEYQQHRLVGMISPSELITHINQLPNMASSNN